MDTADSSGKTNRDKLLDNEKYESPCCQGAPSGTSSEVILTSPDVRHLLQEDKRSNELESKLKNCLNIF